MCGQNRLQLIKKISRPDIARGAARTHDISDGRFPRRARASITRSISPRSLIRHRSRKHGQVHRAFLKQFGRTVVARKVGIQPLDGRPLGRAPGSAARTIMHLRERGNRARFRSLDLEDDRAKHLLDAVRVAKSHIKLVIVAAHWGPNRGYTPQRPHIPFAHRLIDCGADIIFGHSGHVFQGIEI